MREKILWQQVKQKEKQIAKKKEEIYCSSYVRAYYVHI